MILDMLKILVADHQRVLEIRLNTSSLENVARATSLIPEVATS